jgi:signal peptidase I
MPNEKEPMETFPKNFSNPHQAAAPETELSPAPPAPAPTPRRRAGGLKLWLRDILISVAIAVLIVVFLYQPVRVEGTSMLPRLDDQDRLFVNKFVYRFTAIERGDVVVFHYPRDPEKSYIKRVIALPGDRLRIDHGTVWLNGQPQSEPYIPDEYRDAKSMPEIVVPEGSYFMMGDHRSISSDSREFGSVERSFIYGKAAFVYWPASDAGTVR